MAEPRIDNSCQRWRTIVSANVPRPCLDCYTPRDDEICLECKAKIIEPTEVRKGSKKGHQVEEEEDAPDPCAPMLRVKFNVEEKEIPIRRIIDTKALCKAPEAIIKNPPCFTECRPLETLLHLQEFTRRPFPKASYKFAAQLDDETFSGRAFPMKIRIRRIKRNCLDCGKELLLREPVTVNTSVVVLSNCCDVTVYDKKYLENWHRVPVVSVSGGGNFKKQTLNEVCSLHTEPPKVKKLPEEEPESGSARNTTASARNTATSARKSATSARNTTSSPRKEGSKKESIK